MSQQHYQYPNRFDKMRRHRRGDKRGFGVAIIAIGIFILLKKLNLFYFDFHSFWPFILIALGLFIGVQKKFSNHAWWVLILIGVVHLIPKFTIPGTTTSSSSIVAPIGLIIGGLLILFRSKKNRECSPSGTEVVTSTSSNLDIDITFGGRKEIVTSKDFRGGNIQVTFGGCEINLIQADSTTQPMVLDIKAFCSGVELIVPAHWELQNEISPTVGSVEDHRTIRPAPTGEEKKILILRGSCTCAGIEIKSY